MSSGWSWLDSNADGQFYDIDIDEGDDIVNVTPKADPESLSDGWGPLQEVTHSLSAFAFPLHIQMNQ